MSYFEPRPIGHNDGPGSRLGSEPWNLPIKRRTILVNPFCGHDGITSETVIQRLPDRFSDIN
jgi:hypothetical protein